MSLATTLRNDEAWERTLPTCLALSSKKHARCVRSQESSEEDHR
jgi:hypothetical protein